MCDCMGWACWQALWLVPLVNEYRASNRRTPIGGSRLCAGRLYGDVAILDLYKCWKNNGTNEKGTRALGSIARAILPLAAIKIEKCSSLAEKNWDGFRVTGRYNVPAYGKETPLRHIFLYML